MSVKGFFRSLRMGVAEPDSLKNMTPEERAERRRQSAKRNMFVVQMFDMPEPRPYKAPVPPSTDQRKPRA